MQEARKFHTAELLPDGRVLVVGGQDSKLKAMSSTELYDPQTGAWSQTGSMSVPRRDHNTILLPDGRVLVIGGVDADLKALSSAEIYDPQTGEWSTVPSMAVARRGHSALPLADGRVLVFGGRQIAVSLLDSDSLQMVETFDPASGQWSNAPDMAMGHIGLDAVVLADGRVLVSGGVGASLSQGSGSAADQSGSGGVDTTGAARPSMPNLPELYDPAAEKWRDAGFVRGTMAHTLTLLEDGQALQAGGFGTGGTGVPDAEIYDPRSGKWEQTSPMVDGRMLHTATLLDNGMVLVVGGTGAQGNTRSAELFDPATRTWSPAGQTSVPRAGHTATLLQDGTVLIAGGGTVQVDLFDPASSSWR